MYKATGIDYGVTEFDFSTFDPKNFKKLGQEFGGVSNIEGIPGQIYDFLLSKGVPPVGAAAIIGNINGESSFNPAAVNEIGASGLCQWLDGRLDALKALASSRGVDWTDVDVQLEHLWNELEYDCYRDVYDVIMNATEESDLEYATWYWGRHFEVFFLGEYEETRNMTQWRYNSAKDYYQKFLNAKASDTENDTETETN